MTVARLLPDLDGEEMAQLLGGVVPPSGETCDNCDEEAMLILGEDRFCDHHARDLALQIDPDAVRVKYDFIFADNGAGEGSLL